MHLALQRLGSFSAPASQRAIVSWTPFSHGSMAPKRKTKALKEEEVEILPDELLEEEEVPEPKPKKKRAPAKAKAAKAGADDDLAAAEEKPKKQRAPAKPKPKPITEPTQVDNGWVLHPPSLVYRLDDSEPSTKIAAFDMDGTLVFTKSGLDFPRGPDDWQLYNQKVPSIIQHFAKDGYRIVVFSNQGGIKSALDGKASNNQRTRFAAVIKKLGVPASAFMATQKDDFRKPATGMWDLFVKEANKGIEPDLEESFFVGDAAGRDADKVGDSDQGFASNVGIKLKTPEEAFGDPDSTKPEEGKPKEYHAEGPNAELSNIFNQLADIAHENPFKMRAFRAAAKTLEDHATQIKSSKEAGKLKGIGKGSQAIIEEYLTTGEVAALSPEVIAEKAEEKRKEAEAKATGDAFLFA